MATERALRKFGCSWDLVINAPQALLRIQVCTYVRLADLRKEEIHVLGSKIRGGCPILRTRTKSFVVGVRMCRNSDPLCQANRRMVNLWGKDNIVCRPRLHSCITEARRMYGVFRMPGINGTPCDIASTAEG